ncbi:hypothetical protein [Bradyrhizobium arachidis]|uniref:hypothetical protein n=1 Tax=Bradyrhizobium arachidis TaxID=858423 RepID=UPI002163D983|nr:hypothetical protein [Bradyrhizobium arachidis]UVO30315.1 hypothetical protein KUF59_06120 [Bradyrhizobium arachidis]
MLKHRGMIARPKSSEGLINAEYRNNHMFLERKNEGVQLSRRCSGLPCSACPPYDMHVVNPTCACGRRHAEKQAYERFHINERASRFSTSSLMSFVVARLLLQIWRGSNGLGSIHDQGQIAFVIARKE